MKNFKLSLIQTMHHRDGIRPRPIDDHKPYLIFKDLAEAKKTADKERQIQIDNIEKDLNSIIGYFDKIKKNQIPKAKIINEKNDKNDKNINYNINNNIIYIPEKNDASNQNNSQYVLNYKLTEFKRPDNYIIYSSSLKDKINSQKKVYEATEADKIFLNIRENFMKLEELENIIIDFEEIWTNEKDEKDDKKNEESARKIIESKYPKYMNYADSIINHFKDRRTCIKKSLIRKKWHKIKSTDKFLTNTFKKRTGEKRQTRKSNQNKEESLNKIKEAEHSCNNYLRSLMEDMSNKEKSNKMLLTLEEFIFLSEIEKIKQNSIPNSRIDNNNRIKQFIEKDIKIFQEKEIKKINDGYIGRIGKETKGNKNMLINDLNHNTNDNKNIISNISIINSNKNDEMNSLNKSLINDNKNINSILDSSSINNKKTIDKKANTNKNQGKNKNTESFPNVSLNCLLDTNISLNEENSNNNKVIKKNNMRIRIRINKNGKAVIDRYIQDNKSFDPFNDSFNNLFSHYSCYETDESEYLNNNNFEKLYKSYNLNKLNNLNLLNDSDDDEVNGDLKQFSNSYKQFLKSKRAQAK